MEIFELNDEILVLPAENDLKITAVVLKPAVGIDIANIEFKAPNQVNNDSKAIN